MMDELSGQSYVAYPRQTYGSAEKLIALGEAFYSYPWWAWIFAMFVGSFIAPVSQTLFILVICVFAAVSFAETYRRFKKIAVGLGWSRTSPGVAAFAAAMNMLLLGLSFVPGQPAVLALEAYLAIGVLFIVWPDLRIRMEIRRYGIRASLFRPARFKQDFEDWEAAHSGTIPQVLLSGDAPRAFGISEGGKVCPSRTLLAIRECSTLRRPIGLRRWDMPNSGSN